MIDQDNIMAILETVSDPEVPVLSVVDLGIVRELEMEGDTLHIQITPTYTGCPAMQLMEANIRAAFDQAHIPVHITTVLHPPWTTDWMSERGKEKLKAYGIAPPYKRASTRTDLFAEDDPIPCPRCQSTRTQKVSEFGSTACKALYRCLDCLEPFDYFKCH